MDFRRITIPPKGRNKYGNYQSIGNISKQLISYTNNGNGTATGTTNGDGYQEEQTPQKNYSLRLSRNTNTFEWDDIVANEVATDYIEVLGFGDFENVPTFVANFDAIDIDTTIFEGMSDEEIDAYISNYLKDLNYFIDGVEEGMSVEVLNNGTSATTLAISINEDIKTKSGSLFIPCNIYIGPDNEKPADGDMSDWYNVAYEINTENGDSKRVQNKDTYKQLILEYKYDVLMNAVNNYHLELTNEMAGVNVDSAGNIVPGAVLPTCKATLYYGNTIVEDATYGIGNRTRAIDGVSINTNTGELTFGNNFTFVGDLLEIPILATVGTYTATKIMSINKLYPGKDGAGSINRWIVPSVDVITWNPNDNHLSEATLTAKVMKQVDGNTPEVDTATTIYYGWDTENPINVYNGPISIEISKSYLALALKANNVIYEIETVPVIKEGKNGEKGESSYTLILTNTNASINCDANGNILTDAKRPECEALLYYGTELMTGVTFSITTTATGVEIQNNKLVYDRLSTFNFTGDTVEIKVEARINNVLYGTGIMNISKVLPGKNGTDAITYWLEPTYSCFQVTSAGSPRWSTINIKAYKQVGANAPEVMSNPNIKVSMNSASFADNLTSGNLSYNSSAYYYMVGLFINGVLIDRLTIPVLRDGVEGPQGVSGATGPSIRGPYDYMKMTPVDGRRWCNGVLTNINYPEDAEYIDIIFIDDKYYKCKTSYNSDSRDWDQGYIEDTLADYWEESDATYDFVATNLLLAENAKINFTNTNNLYLLNKDNVVTGGAKGADETDKVIYWAGGATPASSKFTVDSDGKINAQIGSFGCMEIVGNGEDDVTEGSIKGYHKQDEGEGHFELSPYFLEFTGGLDEDGEPRSYTKIAGQSNADIGTPDGSYIQINVGAPDNALAIDTNGDIVARKFITYDNTGYACQAALTTLPGFTIVPMTNNSSLFTKVTVDGRQRWAFNNAILDSYLDAEYYTNVRVNSESGYWEVYNSYGGSLNTGIASMAAVREGNKLYIQI